MEQNQTISDATTHRRLISRTFIYGVFGISSMLSLFVFLSKLTTFFEVTNVERIFFHFMSYRQYNEDFIVLVVMVNLLLSVILVTSIVWNIYHKDTKWLFILAFIEIVITLGSIIFIGMLALGGPLPLRYRSEICSSFRNQKESDTCFKETAIVLADCKKILDFEKKNGCINFLLNYPKVTEEIPSCATFETERNRDDCVINYTSKANPSLCLYIENVSKRDQCIAIRANSGG